jgi:hypothetical protein
MPAGFVPDEESGLGATGFDENEFRVAEDAVVRLVRFSRPKH